MPRDTVQQEAQGTFLDEKLQVPEDVIDSFQEYLDNKEAASKFAKARTKIREAIPEVSEATRFLINELWIVESTPYTADDIEIPGGRRQRNKVGQPSAD